MGAVLQPTLIEALWYICGGLGDWLYGYSSIRMDRSHLIFLSRISSRNFSGRTRTSHEIPYSATASLWGIVSQKVSRLYLFIESSSKRAGHSDQGLYRNIIQWKHK